MKGKVHMKTKYEVGQEVITNVRVTETVSSIEINSHGAIYHLLSGKVYPEMVLASIENKPTQPIAPQEDKRKYKSGDKVRVTGNTNGHCYKIGKIVELCGKRLYNEASGNFYWSTDSSRGFVRERDIEPYVEPEQPKSKYDNMSNDELKQLACGISELCCPTLSNKKRKSDCPFFHTRCEVTNENRSEIIQYLIDEETPEPEKKPEPVYFSGKVVCTVTDGDGTFTVGKVYEFVDGQVLDNKSYKRPTGMKMKSLNDGYLANWYYRFIPYLGEA